MKRLAGMVGCALGLLSACDVVWPEERSSPDSGVADAGGKDDEGGLAGDGAGEDAAAEAPPDAAQDEDDGGLPTVLSPGDHALSLSHGGMERTFLVHVPSSYDGSNPVPLLFDIHGLSSTAVEQRSISGWTAKSDEVGFVLVHPQGVSNSWNGGTVCCGQAQTRAIDDEGFVRALVAYVKSAASIDAKRIYVTGLSNGGALTHLLACRASDVFAAAAPVSMSSNGAAPCTPSRALPVVMFRATSDRLVRYEGGPPFASAAADLESWRAIDGCEGEPTYGGPCATYKGCRDGAEVTLCTVITMAADEPYGGHVLYPQALRQGLSVPDFVWRVFERHALP